MTIIKAKQLSLSHSTAITFSFVVLCFFIAGNLYSITLKKKIILNQQTHAINLDSDIIKVTSLGQKRMIASSLWIETLLNSDLDHYNSDDLQNWMFLRFKTITDLDPYFQEVYLYGGIYLSIIKDDEKGAQFIYERGLRYFPKDFYLNLNASFHYFYELNNIDKSLEHLSRIYDHPKAPSFLPSLYARLQSTRGDLKSALALLLDLYKSTPNKTALKKSYAQKIYALKAEIDLNCLNSRIQKYNCIKRDFYGDLYLKDNEGFYRAKRQWKPFRAKKAPAN